MVSGRNRLLSPEPAPEVKREYFAALGEFVHEFAHVERMTLALLWQMAGLTVPVARAILSGVRADAASNLINRILEVSPPPAPGTRADLQDVFGQLGLINSVRNSLLHLGTEFADEGTEFVTSNRFIALDKTAYVSSPCPSRF